MLLWFAAVMANPDVPAEMNLNNWRVVQSMLSESTASRSLERLYERLMQQSSPLLLTDYLAGSALNSPFAMS